MNSDPIAVKAAMEDAERSFREILDRNVRFLFAMMDAVGNARTCVVSFVDSGGIRHSIEVAAESLY